MFVELARNGNQDNLEFSPILIDGSDIVFVMPAAEFVPADEPLAGLTDYAIFSKSGPYAQLENRCSMLACRVNGAEVPFGAVAPVRPGDAIEIGVAALVAHGEIVSSADTMPLSQPGQSIDPDDLGAAVDPLFIPRPDVDAAEEPATSAADPHDFSDLIALAGAFGNIERYHDHPDASDPLSILDSAPGAVSPDHLLFADAHADPLVQLSEEYRQTMLHGGRDPLRELKDRRPETSRLRVPEDPFLDAPERFADGSLLDDLLGPRQSIDTVLDELDSFSADLLFAADERQEVLTLVAPQGLVKQHAAAPSAQLARREHHLISVDSHFPLADTATPHLPESAHDPLA